MLWSWLRNLLFQTKSKPLPEHLKTGAEGEKRAREYLKKELGMRFIHQNWQKGKFEIDLIFQEGAVLVFIEVRTRAVHSKVPGFATLSKSKRQQLTKAGQQYLKSLREKPKTYR